MRSRFHAAVVASMLAGCAEEPPDLEEVTFDVPPGTIHTISPVRASEEAELAPRVAVEEARCQPMSDEGPCALICDPEELLEQYVPEHTCIHFVCSTLDGTRHHLGACR